MSKNKGTDWLFIGSMSVIGLIIVVLFVNLYISSAEANKAIREDCEKGLNTNEELCGCIGEYDSVDFCVEQYGDY